jgi:hypothetical protein
LEREMFLLSDFLSHDSLTLVTLSSTTGGLFGERCFLLSDFLSHDSLTLVTLFNNRGSLWREIFLLSDFLSHDSLTLVTLFNNRGSFLPDLLRPYNDSLLIENVIWLFLDVGGIACLQLQVSNQRRPLPITNIEVFPACRLCRVLGT